ERALAFLSSGFAADRFLGQDCTNARNVTTNLSHTRGFFELPSSLLETKVELLFLEVRQLFVELVRGLGPDICGLHNALSYSTMRCTKRVLIGSFAAPRRRASCAISKSTPSISNMMRPGLTRHAQ